MSASSTCWGRWSGSVTTPAGDGCGHRKDGLLKNTQLLRQGKNTGRLGIFLNCFKLFTVSVVSHDIKLLDIDWWL